MSTYERTDRVTSLLRELAATFIRHEANTNPLITVTAVEISPDLKQATVLISVFPEAQEEQALIFLKRKGGELRSFVKYEVNLKDIPFFAFAIDYGEKSRQQFEEIAYEATTREKD